MNMKGIYVDLVFDTLLDVIACKELKDGMVVQTLGRTDINDNYGATYKIYKNKKGGGPLEVLDESGSTEEGGGETETPTEPDPGEGGGSAGAGDEDEDNSVNEITYTEVILREDLPTDATYVELHDGFVAMLIDSTNLYDRFDQVYSKMSSVATQAQQTQDAVNALNQSLTEGTIALSVEATNTCGVEIVQFMNGQKAVVVTAINPNGRTTDGVDATLSGNIASISVPVSYKGLRPVTLDLLGISNEKLYINDNCNIAFDGGHRNIVFTVNRQLSPAIYFYM